MSMDTGQSKPKHGAHIFVPRRADEVFKNFEKSSTSKKTFTRWFLEKAVEKVKARLTARPEHGEDAVDFLYTHHGIYYEQVGGGYVIDFGPEFDEESELSTSKPKPKPELEHDPVEADSIDEDEKGVVEQATKMVADGVAGVILKSEVPGGVRIKKTSLEKFINNQDGCFFLYCYKQQESSRKHLWSTKESIPRGDGLAGEDGKNAAEVALWFLENPEAFGKYKPMQRNCEHFATFCHKTTLTKQQLTDEKERITSELANEQQRSASRKSQSHHEEDKKPEIRALQQFVEKHAHVAFSHQVKGFFEWLFGNDAAAGCAEESSSETNDSNAHEDDDDDTPQPLAKRKKGL